MIARTESISTPISSEVPSGYWLDRGAVQSGSFVQVMQTLANQHPLLFLLALYLLFKGLQRLLEETR